MSPDGNKLVFKDQDPNQHEKATIAWSDIHEIPATSYISVDCYEDEIYLPESFFLTGEIIIEYYLNLIQGFLINFPSISWR